MTPATPARCLDCDWTAPEVGWGSPVYFHAIMERHRVEIARDAYTRQPRIVDGYEATRWAGP